MQANFSASMMVCAHANQARRELNGDSRDQPTHRLARAVGTHNDGQRLEELNDFGLLVGIRADALNREFANGRHRGALSAVSRRLDVQQNDGEVELTMVSGQ